MATFVHAQMLFKLEKDKLKLVAKSLLSMTAILLLGSAVLGSLKELHISAPTGQYIILLSSYQPKRCHLANLAHIASYIPLVSHGQYAENT